ncbi:Leucine-rich repeat transmembrane protein kinase [Thalictrum thalictroides]|uniref:Leucine-rich repeat transmembrane protein kinase n=1 Tax=Thalictrum thalictroides TaxID=46969 RepID=A0A7J6VQA9_THATH|nr:Leucine-rich repeat transmembrane protein kinase [Thalictrum thalictroides]
MVLSELRISDLNIENTHFPDLQNLNILTDLVLRNCSIIGSIPPYIGERIRNIKRLDLSFNRLTGMIPENMAALTNLQFMGGK